MSEPVTPKPEPEVEDAPECDATCPTIKIDGAYSRLLKRLPGWSRENAVCAVEHDIINFDPEGPVAPYELDKDDDAKAKEPDEDA